MIEHRELLPATLDRGRSRWFADRCTHLSRLSARLHCQEFRQPTQIDYRRREREEQLDLRQSTQLHLAKYSVLLGVTKHRLDELAGKLTELVSRVARRASIDATFAIGGVLGNVRRDRGWYAGARAEYEGSLTILRRVGDRYHEGMALWQIGVAAQQQGDFETAQATWRHALSILGTLGCTEAEEVRGLLAFEPAGSASPTAQSE